MFTNYQEKVIQAFFDSQMTFREEELAAIEYADFGLNNIEEEGLNLLVYVNNERYCAKELVLLPYQTCPEHKHPPVNGTPGKRETFRCRQGKVYLYVEGANGLDETLIHAALPQKNKQYYTAAKEIVLLPGEQFTIEPDTYHWFQAGEAGAVISEFSSPSDDASDVFQHPYVKRV